MKCQKCGFVSFDYLSQCKKCGADLTAVREKLGFSALKSDVPFLLGTLLKDGARSDIFDPLELEPLFEKPSAATDKDGEPQEAEQDEQVIKLSEADLEDLPGIEESRTDGKGAKDL
jgi:hypothetical protein